MLVRFLWELDFGGCFFLRAVWCGSIVSEKFVELLLMVLFFDMGDVPDFVHCFHEVLGWCVGLCVLWAHYHAVYASPLHVLMIIMSVKRWSFIGLCHLWEAISGKDAV